MEELTEIFHLHDQLELARKDVLATRNPEAIEAFRTGERNVDSLTHQLGMRIIQAYKITESYDLLDAQVVEGVLTISCMPGSPRYTRYISFEFDCDGLISIKHYSNPYSLDPFVVEMG